MLVDVYENFRNMCLEIYELDHTYFASAPRLPYQACLKKTGVELELITNYDMILMKKGLGVEFAKQHTGMLKQIINI